MRAVLVPVDLEPSSGFYPERQVRRLPLQMPGDVGGSACLVLTAIHRVWEIGIKVFKRI